MERLTQEDVAAIRAAAEGLLYEGTQRLGSEEHKERFLREPRSAGLISLVDTEPVGGTQAIRERAKQALAVADKIEQRLSL